MKERILLAKAVTDAVVEMIHLRYQQFAPRVIFHPLHEISRQDVLGRLFQSSDFDVEDAIRLIDLSTEVIGFTLKRCTDAVADMLILSREDGEDTAAGNNTDGKSRISQPTRFHHDERNLVVASSLLSCCATPSINDIDSVSSR